MADTKTLTKTLAQFILPLGLNVLGLLLAAAVQGVVTDMVVMITGRPRDKSRSKTMTGIQWMLFGTTIGSVFALIGMCIKALTS